MSTATVSFTCEACEAVLAVPLHLAGVTGPCPCCGTVLISPHSTALQTTGNDPFAETMSPDELPAARAISPPPPVTLPDAEAAKRRRWSTGGLVACSTVLFLASMGGAWYLWNSLTPKEVAKRSPAGGALLPGQPAPLPPRAAVLAVAGPSADGAGSREELPPAPGAVARDVSMPVSLPVTADTAVESGGSAGTARVPAGEAEKQIREAITLTGYLEKPGEAMVRFFAAGTWQERLKYTLSPEKMQPLMEAYYKVAQDGPIIPEDIKLARVEPVDDDPSRKYYAFKIYLPDRESPIPLSVEDTPAGCKVEWCSFIEGKDQLLEKFYHAWRKEPGTFRVLLERGHYFEKDVPDQSRKVFFRAYAPDRTTSFPLWLEKDSDAFKKYFAEPEQSHWGMDMMVLRLQWERTKSGVEYVRIVSVVAENWHPSLLPGSQEKNAPAAATTAPR